MSAGIINNLNGYVLQDARVDEMNISGANTAATVINRTADGKMYGIEVRNNRLKLTHGGYYEDATVFELVEQSIVLADDGDVEYEHDFTQVDDAAYLDWIKDGKDCGIFVMGTNGKDEFGYQFDGHFEKDRDEAGTYNFGVDNGAPTDYGINGFKVVLDETTPQYLFYVEKDARNENTLTIQELAMYLPQFAAMPFPGDMIETGDGLIASGDGLRVDIDWLNQYLADNFNLTPSGDGGL